MLVSREHWGRKKLALTDSNAGVEQAGGLRSSLDRKIIEAGSTTASVSPNWPKRGECAAVELLILSH